MKKSINVFLATAFIAGAVLTSCNTPAEKVEDAHNKVMEAKEDLNEANEEYLIEVENYKKETAKKITANDQTIIELKARMEFVKKGLKESYRKQIAALEQRNNDMKKKIDEYKVEGKEKWETFKAEFSHDLIELGKAFNDLKTDNVK